MSKKRYTVEFLHRPGLYLQDDEIDSLVSEMRAVAGQCFSQIPEYQALAGTREDLSDKVITLARDSDGKLVGFCSALLLDVEGVGPVLHLGLTCVGPGERGAGLTHVLTSRLVFQYLLTRQPLERLWVSNVACVLSSLGNVARHFDDVFPSPEGPVAPGPKHTRIAQAIDRRYRKQIAINDDAVFDAGTFVMRGSVRASPFQKDAGDPRFQHRDRILNEYYGQLMRFEEGDEVVQVGHLSILSGVKYLLRRSGILKALRTRRDMVAQA